MSVLTANFYFLQSPGQGGTQLLSMSTCSLVNHKEKKKRKVFFLLFTFNSDGNRRKKLKTEKLQRTATNFV